LWAAGTAVGLFLLSLVLFYEFLRGKPENMPGDQYMHITYSMQIDAVSQRVALPVPHPFYHYTLALLRVLSPVPGWAGAKGCAVLLLALMVAWRGWLTFREIHGGLPPAAAAGACLLLALAMALPKWWDWPHNYLGQVNPNVWHNPTAIFAAPLTLLVFVEAMRYLDAPRLEKALTFGICSALCALAKPNYLLALFPCFGLLMLAATARQWRDGRLSVRGALGHALGAFGPSFGVLLWQFLQTFGGENRVVFDPLGVWTRYVDWYYIPVAIVSGLAFPVTVAVLFPRAVWRDRGTLLCWCVMAVALAQFALLAEMPDDRHRSGNFGWAMVAASYVLFVASCRLAGQQPRGWRAGLSFAVLWAQAVSGAFYLARALADPPQSPYL
jgi:hypothetical protein